MDSLIGVILCLSVGVSLINDTSSLRLFRLRNRSEQGEVMTVVGTHHSPVDHRNTIRVLGLSKWVEPFPFTELETHEDKWIDILFLLSLMETPPLLLSKSIIKSIVNQSFRESCLRLCVIRHIFTDYVFQFLLIWLHRGKRIKNCVPTNLNLQSSYDELNSPDDYGHGGPTRNLLDNNRHWDGTRDLPKGHPPGGTVDSYETVDPSSVQRFRNLDRPILYNCGCSPVGRLETNVWGKKVFVNRFYTKGSSLGYNEK